MKPKLTPAEIKDIARLIRWRARKAEEKAFLARQPKRVSQIVRLSTLNQNHQQT